MVLERSIAMNVGRRGAKVVGTVGAAVATAGVVVFVVSVVRGTDYAEWGYLYLALFLGGGAVVWWSEKLSEPGPRQVQSETAASAGPMLDGYASGSYEVDLHGRTQPLYRFSVGGVPVTMRRSMVTVGSNEQWQLSTFGRRTTLRGDDDSLSAVATRTSLVQRRWHISDDFGSYELKVHAYKRVGDALDFRGSTGPYRRNFDPSGHMSPGNDPPVTASGLAGLVAQNLASLPPTRTGPAPWGDIRRVWHRVGELATATDPGIPAGTVALDYTKDQRHGRGWSGMASGSNHWQGAFEGRLDLEEAVSLPVVLLSLRLTLGKWSLMAPRTGQWHTTQNAS